MECKEDSIEKKLLQAFHQFKRASFKPKHSSLPYKHSEILVLFCLKKASPEMKELKVSEISKHFRVTPPTVTQLIKGMEKNGLVQRKIDEADRRAVRIKLTKKGEQISEQAEKELFESVRGLVEHLGEEESNHLARLLTKVTIYYHQDDY